ncbi:imidazole glycerol phosphate synthase subunit HisF [Crocinitomix catalasitica]|uniref:imidazole glycerol phosphate synthase subunit HisF n=1 Tax=Crocinitomix catalasitica TaxID=184607 RepID=UPI000488F729|nr:imidazole glycerol phosphate synthase subunit HisF [Crocinitomix catalasitica]
MLKKRIIPCLDIQNGRTVKGVNFVGLRDAGDPVEMAEKYAKDGADELVFLDITATIENRDTLIDLVSKIAERINIPFTVGGGIRTLEDAARLIQNGADKVSLNSAAISNPSVITDIKQVFGAQSLVIAIDAKRIGDEWFVFSHGGRKNTGLKVVEWAKEVELLGAGEILLTTMDSDGTKNGFNLELLEKVNKSVNIPLIASGGAGNRQHFKDLFTKTKVSAGLAASIFHFGEISIPQLKTYLLDNNLPIRK